MVLLFNFIISQRQQIKFHQFHGKKQPKNVLCDGFHEKFMDECHCDYIHCYHICKKGENQRITYN